MSAQVKWFNANQTVLQVSYGERWTAHEFHETFEEIENFLRQKPYPVDLLVDLRPTLEYPRNLFGLARKTLRDRIPNMGQVVVVTDDIFWHRLYPTLQTIIPKLQQLTFVESIEEAKEILQTETVPTP